MYMSRLQWQMLFIVFLVHKTGMFPRLCTDHDGGYRHISIAIVVPTDEETTT